MAGKKKSAELQRKGNSRFDELQPEGRATRAQSCSRGSVASLSGSNAAVCALEVGSPRRSRWTASACSAIFSRSVLHLLIQGEHGRSANP